MKPFFRLSKHLKWTRYYKHHLCLKFQAYASGCNIVILSSKFNRVQIIPGVCHDNIQISCLDCSVDSGRIAAAYANEVVIFEPTPLLRPSIEENYKSRWINSFSLTLLYVFMTSLNLKPNSIYFVNLVKKSQRMTDKLALIIGGSKLPEWRLNVR